jgi:DNA-binding transcriptional regulator YdaS (Cro superfamily)
MNLAEYFQTQPRGSKNDMANRLGVTKTWLSLIISGKKIPSPALCNTIELITKGKVKRKELRPDIFLKPSELE